MGVPLPYEGCAEMLIEDLVITAFQVTRVSLRPYAAIRFERGYTGGARLL
jgi:hypothetical protein